MALLAVAAWAVLVLPLLPPPDLASPLLLQLSVVMLVAWYGGFGPGVVATAAAALLIDYIYLPPTRTLSVRDSSDGVRLGVFLLEGTLVSYISGSLRAAEARARHGERRLAVAVHSAPLTLYHLDRELRYTWIVNPHPDLAPGRIVGRHVGTMLAHADDEGRRDIVDFHRTVLQTGRGARREVALRWSDATRVYDMAVEPLYDQRGAVVGLTGAALDVTDHRRAERALREARVRLRRFVDSNVIGVAYWEADGPITDGNRAFLDMIDRTEEELHAGRLDWRRLVPPERLRAHEQALEEIRVSGTSTPIESEMIRADGARVPILCAGASLGLAPLRGVSWMVDITDRRRAEAQREELLILAERARAEAEAASRAKDEFLAMLGHELRNPLSAVRNAILVATLDEPKRVHALEIARRGADRLTHLVDDLLDVARITQRRIVLRRERVEVATVVERAIDATAALMEDLGHRVLLRLPGAPAVVEADPARLEQVLVNLLSNAARYTPAGGRIELSAAREGNEVVLCVRDGGIGIAPDMLPRVFDLFAQAERGLDRAEGGLGIGLTIVKSVVELHGGRVEAFSGGPNAGSEFVVRLQAASEAPQAKAAGAQADRPRSTHVLLVEDNPDVAEGLAMLLELLGHHVRVASDGLAAVECARASAPDLMLVDIGLPGIDGYEVARRVRQEPDSAEIVLVALTGYGRDEDKLQALAAGFDHHLVKPVGPEVLQDLMTRVGARRGERLTLH